MSNKDIIYQKIYTQIIQAIFLGKNRTKDIIKFISPKIKDLSKFSKDIGYYLGRLDKDKKYVSKGDNKFKSYNFIEKKQVKEIMSEGDIKTSYVWSIYYNGVYEYIFENFLIDNLELVRKCFKLAGFKNYHLSYKDKLLIDNFNEYLQYFNEQKINVGFHTFFDDYIKYMGVNLTKGYSLEFDKIKPKQSLFVYNHFFTHLKPYEKLVNKYNSQSMAIFTQCCFFYVNPIIKVEWIKKLKNKKNIMQS